MLNLLMFNQRTNPLYQKVKEILDAGTIGNLRRVSWTHNKLVENTEIL